MRILVTGGTGFVGKHLISKLVEEHELFCLVRNETRLAGLVCKDKLNIILGDLFASEPFPEGIDVVIHLASLTKGIKQDEYFRINVSGTEALLARLKKQRLSKFILISSLAAAGPSDEKGLTEADPSAPISVYGLSKLDQEKIVLNNADWPVLILRAPIVFGPGDMDMLVALKLIKKGWLLTTGRFRRLYSIIFIKDLVGAIEAALTNSPRQQIYFLGNDQPVEWNELMEKFAEHIGVRKLRRIVLPLPVARVAAEFSTLISQISGKSSIFNRDKYHEMIFPFWICRNEAFKRDFRFEFNFPVNEAIGQTVCWYRDKQLL